MLPPEPKICAAGGGGHTRKSNVSMDDDYDVDDCNDEDDLDEFDRPFYD